MKFKIWNLQNLKQKILSRNKNVLILPSDKNRIQNLEKENLLIVVTSPIVTFSIFTIVDTLSHDQQFFLDFLRQKIQGQKSWKKH